MSDESPENCMQISDLDGFLTAIVVGPDLIKPSEWLPVVWGGESPEFSDDAQATTILGAILGRYNETAQSLVIESIEMVGNRPTFPHGRVAE